MLFNGGDDRRDRRAWKEGMGHCYAAAGHERTPADDNVGSLTLWIDHDVPRR